ncbi:helix-turn-helix domain-containing protein [Pseudocnuella soli]|uniref:helix-turn-helix domain-containing protein n=1 Tax=Pseudocnuella soli TaxID=2502779 RepID=UPI0010486425|nr:helix-turn-helix domain-containing protein [Pseudocnuella soli]
MSSNMKILKTCEYCNQEFIARKTTSKTCSDDCAKRLYKLKQRNSKIQQAEIKEEIKRKPKAFVTEDEIRAIQAKEFLTLKEAALLLNVSPLTLRRWVLAGKVKSERMGKKHMFPKLSITALIQKNSIIELH